MFFKLHLVQFAVKSTRLQKLFVASNFFYFAFVQHYYFIGLADGRKTMGNHYSRSAIY